jgi:membrane protease YdiL (CAAX protease family)
VTPSPPSTSPPASAHTAWRDSLIAFGAVLVLVTVLVRVNIELPLRMGHLGSALILVVFLGVPLLVAERRNEDLRDYGFHASPLGKGLAIAGVAVAAIVPVFTLGFFAFYEIACHSDLLSHLVPHQMCSHYGGLAGFHLPGFALFEPSSSGSPGSIEPLRRLGSVTLAAPALSLEWCLVQWLVVGLPEELFFRGFLLQKLEQRFPPRRRILGGGVGLALVLSAIAFAVIHLPREGDPRALATFFPGLVFGWMRSATGSILASTVTHGCSNILVRILELAVSR